MNPLDAIAPVESVLNVARQAVVTPAAPPVQDALVQKFDSIMQARQDSAVARPLALAPTEGSSMGKVLSGVLTKQEAVLRDTSQEIDRFVAEAKHMNMSELMASNLELSRKVTLGNVSLTSTVAVAQGANKGLQTLLKNQ